MNKLIIPNDKLTSLVSKICRDVMVDSWRPNYIVGLTRGGLIPAVMISHYLNIPMYPLSVSLRDNDIGPESNLWMAEDAFNGKNILVVDDINDSGATINWIIQDWQSGCLPDSDRWQSVWNHNVQFACVVDNLASQCHVKMDFAGMEINKAENNVWVGFPWEDWWTK